ncbi:hypothetical protein WDW86_08790 [Bdellovibrionota bacterium FG-2]
MGDLSKRFNNERELFKFTGLTPLEEATSRIRGRIESGKYWWRPHGLR